MLNLKVGNVFTDIEGFLPEDKYLCLQKIMSFRPLGYEFSPLYNRWIVDNQGKKIKRMWDGRKNQIWKSKSRFYFPTGLLSIVREFLTENNIEHKTYSVRVKPEPNINLTLNTELTVRDYQHPVINKASDMTRGIIKLPTGAGKTFISAGIIQKLSVSPFIFFVTSIDLLVQAKREFEYALRCNGKPITVGQIGGGVVDIRDINVMTVQTAVRALGEKWDAKYKFDSDDQDDKTSVEQNKADILHLLKTAKGVICDEVQHWRAETCQLVARAVEQAYYTYGCSATPYRDEGDDLMIQACFGKTIAEISASYLIKNKWLVKPSIKIVHIRNQKSKFKQWQQIYKEQVSENIDYNKTVASICNAYINNSRLVLVLVQQIPHGKLLASLIPNSIFLSGSSPKAKRQETIKQLQNREISCIISTCIFDEGIDISALDTVILAGGGKSKVRAMQRIGRIMRLHKNKTTATAIDFRIHQKYLLEHSIQREKMYRTEEEYDIEEIDPDQILS